MPFYTFVIARNSCVGCNTCMTYNLYVYVFQVTVTSHFVSYFFCVLKIHL